MRKLRVLVNAVPLATVNTGIGRYLRCLYAALARGYGDRLEIAYFDGRTVSPTRTTEFTKPPPSGSSCGGFGRSVVGTSQ